MKRRILAAILAVVMAVAVFAGVTASADALEDALVYSQDYEGTISGWTDSKAVTLVADPFDAENQVMKVSGSWATFVSEDLPVSTNGTTYTIVFRVYGDCGFFGLTQDQAFFMKKVGICGVAGEIYKEVVNDQWHTYVYTYENTWGRTRLCGQVQSQPALSEAFYVDDVKIYEGDFHDEIADNLPTPDPNPKPVVPAPGGNNGADDNDDGVAGILCIGDSITHGNGLETSYFTSYRYPLWKKLIDAGVSFEMVGPREGNFNKNCTFEEYKGQTFNNKHYAQYGVKLEAMKGTIGTDCANVDFDVAIINLGTNDRKTGNDTEISWTNETLPNWLAEMTNTLRTINPKVTVFLAGLNDNWPGTLNGYIKTKAEEISTTESPVYYIAAPTGWIADPTNANTATLDWVHPNEKGDNMMADAYYDALMANYFNAEPTVNGEPTPSATTVPTATPDTTASATPTTETTVEPTNKPTKKPVKSVKFTKKSVKIKKGKKATLKVTIKGAKKATFSVDKKGKKVVKLSKAKAKSVVVTGKKKGKATITAKAAGKKATCKVTVK